MDWLLGSLGPRKELYQHQGVLESIAGKGGEIAGKAEQTGLTQGATGTTPEIEQALATLKASKQYQQADPATRTYYEKLTREEHGFHPADVAIGGVVRSAANVARGGATPQNAALATTAALVPPLRVPIGAYYALQGAGEALKGKQPGETTPDALERRLLGASTMAAGAATAKSTGLVTPRAPKSFASEVQPHHVEALTSLIENKGGTVDPHATATEAAPHLRETAVRMGKNPAELKGREAGQATVDVAERAVKDVQNEFDTIRKPYNSVLVDQKPIADAYRSAITPELMKNAPKIAKSLQTEAQKFDQPVPLEQVNQFRTRMNRQLDALEKRGTTAQYMSSDMERASKAAANAARDVEYETVGRLSGLDPEYIRALKQREGVLIEAKSSLEKAVNEVSGEQGKAVTRSVLKNPSLVNIRSRIAGTYPSTRGVTHTGLSAGLKPMPLALFNDTIRQLFSDLGPAHDLPAYEQVQPPEAPQMEGGPSGPVPAGEARGLKVPERRTFMPTTTQDVRDYYNYRFDQLQKEMKSAATPEAQADVQRRLTELEHLQQTHPTSAGGLGTAAPVVNGQITSEQSAGSTVQPKPTLTQKMQAQPLPRMRRVTPPTRPNAGAESPAGASRQAQAANIMLLAKQGLISPAEADSRIQKLVGSGGRKTIRRPVAPE